MKKYLFILISVALTLFMFSCNKNKSNVCPAKQCEFGQNETTCNCNPNPNDTTGNGNGNGGTDTPAIIVSKFGNGTNGTIDTTSNYLLNRGWNRDSVSFSFHVPGMRIVWWEQYVKYYNVDGAYELLKDGHIVKLQSSKPNTMMRNEAGHYMLLNVFSFDESVPSDVFNSGEVSLMLGVPTHENGMLDNLNQADMTFNYTSDILTESYDNTFDTNQITNKSVRWKLIGAAGSDYKYYIVMKFTYNGSNYEYRTMLKYGQ